MERYLFVAFRSREHTVRFYETLKSMRVHATVINTPREAEVGCGLSVRFESAQKFTVQKALARTDYQSFIGVFEVVVNGGRKYVTKSEY